MIMTAPIRPSVASAEGDGAVLTGSSRPAASGPEVEPGPGGPARDGAVAEAPLVRGLDAVLRKVEKAAGRADPVEMVHDARKALKEYRALLKLVKSPEASAARTAAAQVARTLAGARDQAAALESLDALKAVGFLADADGDAVAAALGGPPDEAAEAKDHRASLRAFTADARLRLAYGLNSQAAEVDLAAGIGRTYRRARKAEWSTPAGMHETRKSVVAHRYQMSFLAAFAGIATQERAREVQSLRDLFGAYQDIATLRPMVDRVAPALDPHVRARLDAAMERQQQALKAAAQEMHARLFERRLRDFLRAFDLRRTRHGRRKIRVVVEVRRPKIVKRPRIVRAGKDCKGK